ncbi:MAG: hypothetical protein P4L82_07855 [Ancalomicrobiaceae bacterium]|nr:hypothetical protein [Ancalomicrobiaceae bacterium]
MHLPGHLLIPLLLNAAMLASSPVGATEPPVGSPERGALLTTLRQRVEVDLGSPIAFRVSRIDIEGAWAYVSAIPTRGASPLDWSTTKFADAIANDMMSSMVLALLQRRGGAWQTIDYALGPTDVAWVDWIAKYHVPKALFVAVKPATPERDPDTAPIEGLEDSIPETPAVTPVLPQTEAAPSAPADDTDAADLEKALNAALAKTGDQPEQAQPPMSLQLPAVPQGQPPPQLTTPAPSPAQPKTADRFAQPQPPSPMTQPPAPMPKQRVQIDPPLQPIPQSGWHPPADDDGMQQLAAPNSPLIVKNGADGATRPGATRHVGFTLQHAVRLDQIATYHYGAQKYPGTIALRHADGTVYGPWQAAGAVGQGNVPYAYWWVRPAIFLRPGRYTVIDSDPATWSTEDATRGSGIFMIWGRALR